MSDGSRGGTKRGETGRAAGAVAPDGRPAATSIRRERWLAPGGHDTLTRVAGPLDAHLRLLERRLGVEIRNRGSQFDVLGQGRWPRAAVGVLRELASMAAEGEVSLEAVHASLQSAHVDELAGMTDGDTPPERAAYEGHHVAAGPVAGGGQGREGVAEPDAAPVTPGVLRLRRAVVRGRGPRQSAYLESIVQHPLTFGVGPAGTGKTYLAIAAAVAALEASRVRRLVLVRPAVEAGERLGFLPGDLAQKIDPYLRPMFDALYDLLGVEQTARLQERGTIEVAPLAYMRGRTLNESFVILDEAQNTTAEQMKMFLTRIGFGSLAVVNGDPSQNDLPRGQRSGLEQALMILDGVEGVSIVRFVAADVVRHPLVQRIVEAYERVEART
ncbi:MAG: PhoH family protein [Thioalkalivibrionaceae bacterium]